MDTYRKPHISHISRWLTNAGMTKYSRAKAGFICTTNPAYTDDVTISLLGDDATAEQVIAILASHGWTAVVGVRMNTITVQARTAQ
jgi:hypothetical protein